MITDTIKARIVKKYGTSVPGDCNHCNMKFKSPQNGYSRHSDLKCLASQCLMLADIRMLEAKEKAAISDDKQPKTMLGKVSKLNMLGYQEQQDPPWVIMKSENDIAWVNPIKQIGSTKTYKDYFVARNLIVCYTSLKPKYCEVFSIHSGNINIVQDLPEIKHSSGGLTSGRYGMSLEQFESRAGIVYLSFIDPSSNQKLGVLVSEAGDRLAFPYQTKIIMSRENKSDIIVEFLESNQILRLDGRLNVIRAPKTMPFIKI